MQPIGISCGSCVQGRIARPDVLPEVVIYEANSIDVKGLDHSKMTPLLVEAVSAVRAEKDAEIAERHEHIVLVERVVQRCVDDLAETKK